MLFSGEIMGNRSTKLSQGTSSLNLAARDKYISTMSLDMYASDWNLVVRDSFKPESVGLPSRDPQTRYIGPSSHLGKYRINFPIWVKKRISCSNSVSMNTKSLLVRIVI